MTSRPALVDRCDNCGTLLVPMTPGQHGDVEALYRDMAEQLDWPRGSGNKLDPFEWHQLMLGAFATDQGWKPKFLPSLDGDGFTMVVRAKQSRLTKKQGALLVHFANAWAANEGVRRTASQRQIREMAESGA